jgi:hypothetical protein
MSEKRACKDKETALAVLETIMEAEKNDTIRAALDAVVKFIKNTFVPDYSMTPEERRKRIDELLKECGYMRDRDGMTSKERIEAVSYYGEGLRCKTAG